MVCGNSDSWSCSWIGTKTGTRCRLGLYRASHVLLIALREGWVDLLLSWLRESLVVKGCQQRCIGGSPLVAQEWSWKGEGPWGHLVKGARRRFDIRCSWLIVGENEDGFVGASRCLYSCKWLTSSHASLTNNIQWIQDAGGHIVFWSA